MRDDPNNGCEGDYIHKSLRYKKRRYSLINFRERIGRRKVRSFKDTHLICMYQFLVRRCCYVSAGFLCFSLCLGVKLITSPKEYTDILKAITPEA